MLLVTTNALKISQRLQQEDQGKEAVPSQTPAKTPATTEEQNTQEKNGPTESSANEKTEEKSVETKDKIEVPKQTAAVKNVEVAPENSDDVLRITRTKDTTKDSEAETIKLNHPGMQNVVRNAYRELRDLFTYNTIKFILDADDRGFSFTLEDNEGVSEVKRVTDFMSVDSKVSQINELFSIAKEVVVSSLNCHYAVSEDHNSMNGKECVVTLAPTTAFYKVGTKIDIKTVKIGKPASVVPKNSDKSIESITASTDYTDVPYVVMYSGNVNYDDGTLVRDEDTKGMDDMNVPIYMILTKSDIEKYDSNKSELKWIQIPHKNQMTLNLLLNTIDQTRDVNTPDIPSPRGLSSINKLSLKGAQYTSFKGNYNNEIIAILDVPDYDFLPLDMVSSGNIGVVRYTNKAKVQVEIKGELELTEGQNFTTQFFKENGSEYYKINLAGLEGVTLSFKTIREKVYPTISTQEDSILPSDKTSLSYLKTFNIVEDDVKISNPQVEIRLEPYLFYKVSGNITSGLVKGK